MKFCVSYLNIREFSTRVIANVVGGLYARVRISFLVKYTTQEADRNIMIKHQTRFMKNTIPIPRCKCSYFTGAKDVPFNEDA